MSEKTTASLPIVLGLLTAVGLFAIDMYLPCCRKSATH
ncbi:hypothetical protein PDO_4739 [Rhizobium sp. PDO1-076]|nr:hypothetical protein PDO_4739 [Rhizobium sp. PDO1-076]